jgi:starch phosphorylase
MHPGDQDIARAVNELADRLPTPLRPLAAVAFDYRWSWAVDGAAIFAAIEPERWARCGANPLRLLTETPSTTLAKVAADSSWLARVQSLAAELAADRARPCPASCHPADQSDQPGGVLLR